MKGKSLSFPFISFSESGLFNELRTIQIKKSASGSTRVSGCARHLRHVPSCLQSGSCPAIDAIRSIGDKYGAFSVFLQWNLAVLFFRFSGALSTSVERPRARHGQPLGARANLTALIALAGRRGKR
jgi:hypothetical protein